MATIFTEGFENGGVIPIGWTTEIISGSPQNWVFKSGADFGSITTAHNGSYNAMFTAPSSSGVPYRSKLITPPINFGDYILNPTVTFWHGQEVYSSNQDVLYVYYKTSLGGAETLIATYSANTNAWTERTISLPNVNSTYYLIFDGWGYYGNGILVDDVLVTADLMAVTPKNIIAYKSLECRNKRWSGAKTYISYYLSINQSLDLAVSTDLLSFNYLNYGIERVAYDGIDGLFDWIENTGSYSLSGGYSSKIYYNETQKNNIMSYLENGFTTL